MYKFLSEILYVVRVVCVLLLCIISTTHIYADEWDNTSWINTEYNTTEGVEFYATFLKNQGSTETDVDNLDLFLHAAANQYTKVTVTYLFDGSEETFQVQSNSQKTIPIDLAKAYVDFKQDIAPQEQISQRGLCVKSDNPISLYITNSRDGAYAGTCILPKKALGVDYVVQTYHGDHESTMFAVVGVENETKVTLNIKKTELDKTLYQEDDIIKVDKITDENIEIILQKGEVFLYRSEASYKGLSGTRICADKPIAVFNSHQASRIPYYDETLNHLNTQTYPIDKWGRKYVVTPTKNYLNKTEHIRLTSFYSNTEVKKNGTLLCVLDAYETYQDTINGDAVYYECNQPVSCFLYTLGRNAEGNENNKSARPSMSPITPLEFGTNSLLFATFTESNVIDQHYVNLIVEESFVDEMRIDGVRITSAYSDVNVAGTKYKYTQILIDSTSTPTSHKLTNLKKDAAFTARVYGMGYKKGRGEFYAYSAGSRINRKIDVLVDGQYIKEKTICKGSPAINFEGLVGFALDNNDEVQWCIREVDSTDCAPIIDEKIDGEYKISHYFMTDSVDRRFEVSFIVTQNIPSICDGCAYTNTISDTVKVYVNLKTTYEYKNKKDYCYGTEFILHKDGEVYGLTADTVNVYAPLFSEPFKINKKYVIDERLKSDFGCDSIIHQEFYIRVPDTTNIDVDICDNQLPYVFHLKPYTGTNDTIVIDTIRGEQLTLTRYIEYERYSCESLFILNFHISPSYIDTINDTINQQSIYKWIGHEGHVVFDAKDSVYISADSIPANKPGDYVYIDSLKTQSCEECPKCDSIWILNLSINPVYSWDTVNASICDNAPRYLWYTTDAWGNEMLVKEISPLPLHDTTFVEKIGYATYQLNLTINKTYFDTVFMTACYNSGYAVWNQASDSVWDEARRKWIHSSKIPTTEQGCFTYIDSLETINGCDSIIRLYLQVMDGFVVDSVINICDKEYTIWQKRIYKGDKYTGPLPSLEILVVSDTLNYLDSIKYESLQGCDSLHRLTLNVYPSYDIVQDTTISYICDNQIYPFFDTIYNVKGEWVDSNKDIQTHLLESTTTTQYGCDSSIVHLVYVYPTFYYMVYDTICQSVGDKYDWNEHEGRSLYCKEIGKHVDTISLDISGTYTFIDSLKAKQCDECVKCDSVHVLQLTILPSYTILDKIVKFSEEETYTWDKNGKTYGGKNTTLPHDVTVYEDTIIQYELHTDSVGTYVCDSIFLLNIKIGKVYRDTLKDSMCGNVPYRWLGVDKNGNEIERMVIDTPQTKVYQVDFISAMGFDSIFYLDLTVYPSYVDIDSMTTYESTCQYSSYTWKRHNSPLQSNYIYSLKLNKWIHVDSIPTDKVGSFTYIDSLTTINACDSIYTLILHVDSEFIANDSIDICNDTFAIWHGKIFKGSQYIGPLPNDTMPVVSLSPQIYLDTLIFVSKTGCDSTVYLHLNVHNLYQTTDYHSISDQINPYVWTTKDSYGVYFDTIYYDPSLEYVDPLTNRPRKDSIQISRTRALTTMSGCDSIVQLLLTVHPTYRFVTTARICSDDTYEWRGKQYWRTDIYEELYTTQKGYDSIYVLNLYVKPVLEIHRDTSICDDQTLVHTDTLWYGEDSLRYEMINTVLWKPGMEIPRPNESRYIRYKSFGDECDSIVFKYKIRVYPTYRLDTTAVLASNESFYYGDFHISLDSLFSIDSQIVAFDTLLTDTLTTVCGCDSIFACYTTIIPAYGSITYDTICENDSIVWRGRIFKTGNADDQFTGYGDYVFYDKYQTQQGTDSIFELRLHVNPNYMVEYHDTICASECYVFHGDTIKQTGIYYATFPSTHGCDSIFTLYLTVFDTTINLIYDTICVSEKYVYGDSVLTQSGSYGFVTTNQYGCLQYDSIYLEIVDTTSYLLWIDEPVCADDNELVVQYQVLDGPELLEYSVLFDDLGHQQGFEDIHHARLTPEADFFTIPIPMGEPLQNKDENGENRYAYPLPRDYRIKITMSNGICMDNSQYRVSNFNLLYPSWIHEQHWNDGIVLYNDAYNGGHTFSAYQWYQNGDTLYGETKEYLYIPDQLLMNEKGGCDNYYQVELTRASDGYKTMTCPICPTVITGDTIVPTKDYFSIVPTVVDHRNPIVHILSTQPGKYTYVPCNLLGQYLDTPKEGIFDTNENNYAGTIDLTGLGIGTIIINLKVENYTRSFYVLIQ